MSKQRSLLGFVTSCSPPSPKVSQIEEVDEAISPWPSNVFSDSEEPKSTESQQEIQFPSDTEMQLEESSSTAPISENSQESETETELQPTSRQIEVCLKPYQPRRLMQIALQC